MRGQKLFNITLKNDADEQIRKGRRESLIDMRNNCLIARYYYHGHLSGKCYEDVLTTLVSEFFLSATRIGRILMEHADEIKRLKERKVSMYHLRTCWPQYKW